MPTLAANDLSSPELILRLRQQELVAEFGRFALRNDVFQAILDQASIVAARGLETGFAKVLEYLPGDTAFLVRSGMGWRHGVVGQARLGGDLESPAGYAFRSGEPVISNHLANERRFRTPLLLTEHGIRSAINVLIAADDAEPFGVLEVDSTHRGEFVDHDVAFLQALANTLAEGVEAQKRQDARARDLREKNALLREKDLLIQEVNHRVTNSLQLVRSILHMQARTLASPEARHQLDEAAARITTVGAVHRRLYEGSSVTTVDAAEYLLGLLDDMRGMFPDQADGRTLELAMQPFVLDAGDITPLGLIACELVTNAFKYGRGRIQVGVRQQVDGLEISVSDDGGGYPPDLVPGRGGGLGLRLVAALAKASVGDAIQIDRSVSFGRIVVTTGFGGAGEG